MEKVLIEIIGSQNIDNQFDKTEFKTVGTFEELEEKYVIKYKEEQDAGEEPINVSVVVLKDESSVEMTREGAVAVSYTHLDVYKRQPFYSLLR